MKKLMTLYMTWQLRPALAQSPLVDLDPSVGFSGEERTRKRISELIAAYLNCF